MKNLTQFALIATLLSATPVHAELLDASEVNDVAPAVIYYGTRCTDLINQKGKIALLQPDCTEFRKYNGKCAVALQALIDKSGGARYLTDPAFANLDIELQAKLQSVLKQFKYASIMQQELVVAE